MGNHNEMRYRAMRGRVGLAKLGGLCILLALSEPGAGQVQPQQPPRPTKFAEPPVYLTDSLVPSNAHEYLIALGDRLKKQGKERLVLVGNFTDQQGTVQAQLTWEVPGRVRLDKQGANPTSLIFDDKTGPQSTSALKGEDYEVLESLVQDGPEPFLYGFTRGVACRFLGGRFRTDDGKSPNYQGPLYDIYEMIAPAVTADGVKVRPKRYYFDSRTKLFVKSLYIVSKQGREVTVTTEYGRWTNNGGQAVPGQIVRKEDGTAVFTFDVTAGTIGATAQDGQFPGR